MSSTTDKKMTREQAQKLVDSMSYAEVLRMIAILEERKKEWHYTSVEIDCVGTRFIPESQPTHKDGALSVPDEYAEQPPLRVL